MIFILVIIMGCGKKIRTATANQPEKAKWNQIAVLPVANKTVESAIANMLRTHLIEELYFKGFPRVSVQLIDEKLSEQYKKGGAVQPQVVGNALGVDAVLYCTLSEWKKTTMLAYVSISAKVDFELRSARGGEVLWKASKSVIKRSFHPLKKELQELALLDYEPIVIDLVGAALESLPNGPNFVAQSPIKKGALQEWF